MRTCVSELEGDGDASALEKYSSVKSGVSVFLNQAFIYPVRESTVKRSCSANNMDRSYRMRINTPWLLGWILSS